MTLFNESRRNYISKGKKTSKVVMLLVLHVTCSFLFLFGSFELNNIYVCI